MKRRCGVEWLQILWSPDHANLTGAPACMYVGRSALLLCLATSFYVAPATSFACATCGCTLSADAATGYSSLTGWRLNLEMDYIDQTQLRSGTSAATPAAAVNNPSNPALGGGEIEKQTINRYFTLGVSYSPSSNWNSIFWCPTSTAITRPTARSSRRTPRRRRQRIRSAVRAWRSWRYQAHCQLPGFAGHEKSGVAVRGEASHRGIRHPCGLWFGPEPRYTA